jgi:hypothetical protein
MGKRPAERYEPMPGVLELPGWLIGKLTPRNRKVFWTVVAVLGAALVALVIVLAPRISEGKKDRSAADRREAAAATARTRREIGAEQTPHRGSARHPGAVALRHALEGAIVADVARRVRTNETQTPARAAECKVVGALHRSGRRLSGFDCTAVTSVIPKTDATGGGVVGYPYRALGDPRRGRFTFCKISGRAGEGQLTSDRTSVPISKACVG